MPEVTERVTDHYNECLEYFPEDRIVGVFLQGSQNYGLETNVSDVDTKLIVLPTFEEIAFNKPAVSTTHFRANEEHIDFKDVRLMFQTFRKQNVNFVEVLFTDYKVLNPLYSKEWNKLISANEAIAHYNIYNAVKAMRGIALEKYHAMEHRYPSKIEVLDKYGYDPKQLHHLLRVEEFLRDYIDGKPYKDCLHPSDPEYLKNVKLGLHSLEDARKIGEQSLKRIEEFCSPFQKGCQEDVNDVEVDCLLDEVQRNLMKKSLMLELEEKE